MTPYTINFTKKNKLDARWKPYFRIIAQKSPVSFIIESQLDGVTTKAHAEELRLAKIDEWEIPKTDGGRRLRRAAYVVPLESERETEAPSQNEGLESDSDDSSDNNLPLARLAQKYRTKRDHSSSEDDIPQMELG